MALTDANGSVVERYRFDAYGACTVLDADGSADADCLSDVHNPYTFTGRRIDVESGLMQYRYRWYLPTLGRFVSRDRLASVVAAGFYAYVGGRAKVYIDPYGLRGEKPPQGRGQESPACAFIRNLAAKIEAASSIPGQEAAARFALDLYRGLAFGGKWRGKPFASKMLGHWLEGGGEELVLGGGRVKRLIREEAVKASLTQVICAECRAGGWRDYSLPAKSYTPTVNSDAYYALGTFALSFSGKCCRGEDSVKVKGEWELTDTYDWHLMATVTICDIEIRDDWALLVERYHGAEPYPVKGHWEGTITFDCGKGDAAGDGGER